MTQDELKVNAKTSILALDSIYFNKGRFERASFWNTAELIELYIDAYEILDLSNFKEKISAGCDKVIENWGESWINTIDFYDDIAWMCIAFARSYEVTGYKKYLDLAKSNLDELFKKSWDETEANGGCYWRKDKVAKCCCSNSTTAIAACLIGEILKDESYFDIAKKIFNWIVSDLSDMSVGRIYDSINLIESRGIPCGINDSEFTYNAGTVIGLLCLLYDHENLSEYLTYAELVASRLINRYDFDLIGNEEEGFDEPGFRGIMARWVRVYAIKHDKNEYLEWLNLNADAHWKNRNRFSIMHNALDITADDIDFDAGPWKYSSGVSFLINSISESKG